MKLSKSARISLAITTGILTLVVNVMLFIGAFFVNDTLEPLLERPGSEKIRRAIENEDSSELIRELVVKRSQIEERELTIFEKTFLGLLQGSAFILAILVLPLGFALVFKIAPSKDLFYKGIHSRVFRLDKHLLSEAENPGIYKFHRVDDAYFIFSKPKLRRKLIRTFILWTIITTVAFIALYDPQTVEILGLPVAALLITLAIFLRMVLPAPRLVFDRLKGQVILKGNIVNPGFTADFGEISPSMMYGELMAIAHPLFSYGIIAYGGYNQGTWSFYTQYMDKNRPLPLGTALDDYREKDYERRQRSGFKAPLYPSALYICDANSGYINGTTAFKKEIKTFKLKIEDAHSKVLQYMEKDDHLIMEPYKLCFLGLYRDFMVFQFIDEPEYKDLQVFDDEKALKGCYLIHKKTQQIEVH
ncbi:hypothetical protein [Geofilum rubicundum]|uniref:Uncharacterized protein n=1 Tax=Geofilum rubicundum JCM 15548 TaxID=1236989 RepID=A0A0E9LQ72_9BACT|nr:hypothetical protein [Geofilum rubicundum]GAO27762.1 hypothetical protein JCM15548_14612 [Geofilum rubicundum JCM 15548]